MLKYVRLLQDIERRIGDGTYKEGTKLPSIRRFAGEYGVTNSTVIRVMNELEKRHLVYPVAKSGFYVIKSDASIPIREREVIDFTAASPDPAVFPYTDFRHCINQAIDIYKDDLFVYGTPQGLPSLLAVMVKLLADYQVFTRQRNLFVVSGVQQALSLLTAMPFPNGKRTIVVEQPCYHLMVEQLETYGIPVMGIRRSASGIDLEALEQLFRTGEVKFFYTTPRFHNPLGCSFRTEDKKKIVELAHKYDVYLIEDDYMADMEQDAKSDPLYAYDNGSRVIYLKSFSKIIFPGLRIGIAVIPDPLAPVFNQYKRIDDIDSSMLSQGALEIYLKSGMFDKHKRKIRASYAKRSRLLQEALLREAERSGELFAFHASAHPPVHTHIELNGKIRAGALAAALKKEGVLIEPIDKHYLKSFPQENLLKLNVSNVREEDIGTGIQTLIEGIRRMRFL